MTFGPDHYVPVLKVKQGEKSALQRISPMHQSRITPLLEIVVREPTKTLSAHLDTAFTDLAEAIHSYARCFLDTHEIAADGLVGAEEVFRRASDAGMAFTPVTGISRTADVAPALAHRANGLALRLTRAEFERGGLTRGINNFLSEHGLAPEQLDLIIDLGGVEDLIIEGVVALTDAFMAEVPDHQRWHTLTISACSFPKSMGGIDRDSHALVELLWRDAAMALLEKRDAAQGVRGKPRWMVWDRICAVFGVKEIGAAVRAQLKARAKKRVPV